jgi:hypothetical protein
VADVRTRTALEQLVHVPVDAHGAGEGLALLATHQRYGAATEAMFEEVGSDPGAAELYEDTYVDQHFDPLAATLDAHLESRYIEARPRWRRSRGRRTGCRSRRRRCSE